MGVCNKRLGCNSSIILVASGEEQATINDSGIGLEDRGNKYCEALVQKFMGSFTIKLGPQVVLKDHMCF